MSLKVAVIVLGCPKNTVEAEYLLGILKYNGYELTSDANKADILVIHTCSFINDARAESEKCIRDALRLKNSKNVKIYVTGCLPQLLREELLEKYPEIDGYTGTGALDKVPDLILNTARGNLLKAGGLNNSKHRILSSSLPYAYLKIAEGCNHNCSFCIIPGLRGKYKSRTVQSLIDEAKALAGAGIQELVLVAQDTTTYGLDRYNSFSLDKLLSGLSKISGLKWIRLLYAYPSSITESLLDVFREYKNICRYMDIPIQHINGKILARMGRPLNTGKIIEKIKNKIPEISLRTSIITGFPGETEKDVKELISFIKHGYFFYAGVFEYSDQKQALSSKLSGHIKAVDAKRRRIEIENAQYGIFQTRIAQLKNTETEFLAERCVRSGGKYTVYGRSEFQAPDIDGNMIVLSSNVVETGQFYNCVIKGSKGYNIKAVIK
jgi:ribosomal protein S12 methylthiotransferase RimO